MAQTFETQAIVTLVDRVSGPLKALGSSVAASGRHVTTTMGGAMGAIASTTAAATGAVAAVSGSGIYTVGKDMDAALNDMRMFTKATEDQVKGLQHVAQTKGAWAEGGPLGFVKAQTEGLKAGVMPELASLVAEYGSLYARMAGQDTSHGTRELIQHAAMMGEFRDSMGQVKAISALTEKELEHSLKTTLGRMATLTKNTTGWKMDDAFNYFKNAGPAYMAQKIEWADAAAFGKLLAEKGFSGEVSGNAMSSVLGSFTSPKGPSRQALASADLEWSKYAKVDDKALTGEGYAKGIIERIGSIKPQIKKQATEVIDQYHKDMAAAGNDEGRKAAVTSKLRTSLVDITKSLGDKRLIDNAKAGNFVKTFMANAVQNVDLISMLEDAKRKNLGIGFYNALFGKDRGKQIMAIEADRWKQERDFFQKQDFEKNVDEITRKYKESFERASKNLGGSMSGFLDSMFTPWKPALTKNFNELSEYLNSLTYKMTDGQKQAASAAIAGGGAVGALAVVSKLKKMLPGAQVTGGAAAAGGISATVNVVLSGGAVLTVAANEILKNNMDTLGKPHLENPMLGGLNPDMAFVAGIHGAERPGYGPHMQVMNPGDMGPFLPHQTWGPDIAQDIKNSVVGVFDGLAETLKGGGLWDYLKTNGPKDRGDLQDLSNFGTGNPFVGLADAIKESKSTPQQVNGEVTGQCTVDVQNQITVQPSEYFKTEIANMKKIGQMAVQGKLGTSMGGSNGTSQANQVLRSFGK